MEKTIFSILLSFVFASSLSAQFSQADSLIGQVEEWKKATTDTKEAERIISESIQKWQNRELSQTYSCDFYEKSAILLTKDKDSVGTLVDKLKDKKAFKFLKPFLFVIDFARSGKLSKVAEIPTILKEVKGKMYYDKDGNRRYEVTAFRNQGLDEYFEQQNTSTLLDEMFGDVDFYKKESNVLLFKFVNPLGSDALDSYHYLYCGEQKINETDCHIIAFYPREGKDNGFTGFVSIDKASYSLVQTTFTIPPSTKMNFINFTLFTMDFTKAGERWLIARKKATISYVDKESLGGVLADRTMVCTDYKTNYPPQKRKLKSSISVDYANATLLKPLEFWEKERPVALTSSEIALDSMMIEMNKTPAYNRLGNAIRIVSGGYVTIGGKDGLVEWGPILQSFSYNYQEGYRLKLQGATTTNLNRHLVTGGYVAYGTKDNDWKYRANLYYSFHPKNKFIQEYPKNLLSASYIRDLNIPGMDLLTTNRDEIYYSLSADKTDNMSLQRLLNVSYENEFLPGISYAVSGKYLNDSPAGSIQYQMVSGVDTTIIPDITTSELDFNFRYAPDEHFLQTRGKRISLKDPSYIFTFNYRAGMKWMGSDYLYNSTEATWKKNFHITNTVKLNTTVKVGKIWNKVPMPLLYIPQGNQSYIFSSDAYNDMSFYEFVTDQYAGLNVAFASDGSLLRKVFPHSPLRMAFGLKTLWGPLSAKNDPEQSSGLFVFPASVTPLNNTPYLEMNVGLLNLFKILRVDYVRRLTYTDQTKDGEKPSVHRLLVSASFSF